MAITILNKPTSPNVTGTKLVYSVSSSNANQPQFNYVTEVYPSGSLTLLTRLYSYPNLTGNGIVDVAKVLDDNLTYDHDFYNSGSSYLDLYGRFTVKFREAYGTSPSSSVQLTDVLATDELEVFPGIIDANSGDYNFPSGSYIPTVANDRNINLSEVPNEPTDVSTPIKKRFVPVEQDQYSTANFLKSTTYLFDDTTPGSPYRYEVYLFFDPASSPPQLFDVWTLNMTVGTTYNETGIINLGIGPANLKQFSTLSTFEGDTFTQGFNRAWVLCAVFMRATIQASVNTPIFDGLQYNPNASEDALRYWAGVEYYSRFTPFRYCNTSTRFAFINHNGTWDYYNVYSPLRRSTNVNRNIYDKNYVDYSSNTSIYSATNRGETQYLTQYSDNYEIVTPFVGQLEAEFITNLIDSREAFIQRDSVFVPIILTNTSYTWNMDENRQKLFQFTIQFKYANDRISR